MLVTADSPSRLSKPTMPDYSNVMQSYVKKPNLLMETEAKHKFHFKEFIHQPGFPHCLENPADK